MGRLLERLSEEPGELLTARQVARVFDVTEATVFNWEGRGRLRPALRLTKKYVRFERDDVERLARQAEGGAPQDAPRLQDGAPRALSRRLARQPGDALSAKQVAQVFGVESQAVFGWERSGLLGPATRASRSVVRFDRADVERLARRAEEGTSPAQAGGKEEQTWS